MHTHGRTLSFEKAEAIRAAYAEGDCSQAMLADCYDVSQRMVSMVVRGEAWTSPTTACRVCSIEFTPASPSSRYCSEACFVEGRKRRRKNGWRAVHPFAELECPHCGVAFTQQYRLDQRFCSEKCNSAAHHLKRGNGRLGPGRRREIERASIIERDASRCHLCGKRCQPEEIHLDHLVPLAAGGDHSPENLRVACAACNLSKGCRPVGEQLLLVG